jgi:membrane-associated phospholipid phosphatase
MFQTGINLALQSLASDWLTWLMRQITASGYYSSVAAIVLVVMLGIDLRKGFLLFQLFAWTGMVSEFCKMSFGLPRPFFVDGRVLCLETTWNPVVPLHAQGAPTFFSLPPRAAIEAFRLQKLSFGFPSGHVSGSIAMWGGLAVLFRKRWLFWLAPVFVLLVAVTRLYLGVHFLGDVLGGALLGGLVLFLATRFIGDAAGRQRFFAAARLRAGALLPSLLYGAFMFALPLALMAFSAVQASFAGFFVGLNAALTILLRRGAPDDKGPLPVRAARVLTGGLVFLLLDWGLRRGPAWLGMPAGPWMDFIAAGLGSFLTFWLSVRLCLRLGLYRRRAENG